MRTKQLSMAANTTGVICSCACLRYWPYRGVGTCVSVLKLVLLKQLERFSLDCRKGLVLVVVLVLLRPLVG